MGCGGSVAAPGSGEASLGDRWAVRVRDDKGHEMPSVQYREARLSFSSMVDIVDIPQHPLPPGKSLMVKHEEKLNSWLQRVRVEPQLLEDPVVNFRVGLLQPPLPSPSRKIRAYK
ncbi:CPK20 [Symbiodinium necroappetens]|uniref:CPK20 protein n=1 Tax=Symbiodinium necroappetens TaxID=1628268 RepID=A0A812TCC0_9DINO|nr:CPK20 [Symbiodinium necroappetens]